MSLTFDKIIERITDENKVYRNKFIEPYDMKMKKVQELEGAMEAQQAIAETTEEKEFEPRKAVDPLNDVTPGQRMEVIEEIKKNQGLRKFKMNERLEFLNNKMLEEPLDEKEGREIAHIGNSLSKLEKQIKNLETASKIAEGGGKIGFGGEGY